MSNFTLCVIAMWASAAIGSYFTKEDSPYIAAIICTVAIGFGYLLVIAN